MLELLFMPKAIADLGYWVKNDLKTIKKIYSLLENMAQMPFDGLGQPEPLKAKGLLSIPFLGIINKVITNFTFPHRENPFPRGWRGSDKMASSCIFDATHRAHSVLNAAGTAKALAVA